MGVQAVSGKEIKAQVMKALDYTGALSFHTEPLVAPDARRRDQALYALAPCIVLTPEEANARDRIVAALIECVGLLTSESAEMYWQAWRAHPYLDRFAGRELRLAFMRGHLALLGGDDD